MSSRNVNNTNVRQRSKRNGAKRNKNTVKQAIERDLKMMIGTCRLERNPLNFSPIGVNKVYHFLRSTTTITTYTASSGAFVTNGSNCYIIQNVAASPLDSFVALAFQLNDLPDYTEFTNLFDQYAIIGVQVQLSPRINTPGNGGLASNCMVYGIIDCSDITLPASLLQFKESQTIREWSTTTMQNRRWNIKHSPRIAVGAYAGAFSGYAAPTLTWIDAQSPNVQHYGIKLAVPAGASGVSNPMVYDLEFKYHIACRMAQ